MNLRSILYRCFGRIGWAALLLVAMADVTHGQVLVTNGPAIPWLGNGAVAWGDYDGDGDADLLTMGLDSTDTARTYLLENTGTGLVPDMGQNLLGLYSGDADWGDMDNDGDLDLVLTGFTHPGAGVTRVYQNSGGTLSLLSTTQLIGLGMGRARWLDYDGDGDLDLLLTGVNDVKGLIGYFGRNDGGGTFVRVEDPMIDTRDWASIGVGDFDGDGLEDIAFADISPMVSEGIRTEVFHNSGAGQLESVPNFIPKIFNGSLDFGDADGDGDLDLLVAGTGTKQELGVYPYHAGQFQNPDTTFPGIAHGEARWADFDNDGHLDFVVAGFGTGGPGCRVYKWTVSGYNQIQGPTNMPLLYHARLDWADWNGDGHPDFSIQGLTALGKPQSYVAVYNSVNGQFEF